MQARDICLLASREAKGGAGMVALAGQYLNLVLEDLKLNRDLKVNRVTQLLVLNAGTNGPFPLESDYLRTYDLFYSLQGPNGETQFLTPITMEQYDAEFKGPGQAANYPYEFATDLSTQVQVGAVTQGVVTDLIETTGLGYWSLPTLSFGGPGSGAAASATLTAVGLVNPFAAGAGYSMGDILTLVGGTFTRPARIEVIEPGLMTCQVIDGGAYTVLPGNPGAYPVTGQHFTGDAGTLAVTGGTGAGYLARVVWGLGACAITAGGSGYTSAPAVTVTGGLAFPTAGTVTATISGAVGGSAGDLYVYPQSNASIVLTHRYMRNQPDIVSPETSTDTPWFSYTDYLVKHTAGRLMGITGDDRQDSYLAAAAEMLRPHLIMEGDEQQAVRNVRLDPRVFKSARGLRPTKQNPY